MPRITDPPPAEIATELAELQATLDKEISEKALDRNLLIATWNIRAFGDLTTKWQSGPDDSPKRDLHALRCTAEIISRFDVIALQEVRANLKALRHTLKVLGPRLKYVRGGSFDFTKVALKSLDLIKAQLSWPISDHYPLWAEFSVRD